MSHSLIGADRTTHLKMLCVAPDRPPSPSSAVGITARGRGQRADAPSVKAGKPAVFTARELERSR
jgi:hypothetical protein